ncbi:MAG TPA: hypothetical protein VKB86_20555 [Pyrinomonadaceae bacterium]|nr:hypothetical protein [Pyrinomonadaceae bacterium]
MRRFNFLILFFLLIAAPALCQTQATDSNELQVSKSTLQLKASGIRFDGVKERPGTHYHGSELTYKGKLYTESSVPPDGFVVQDIATDTFTVYQLVELARAAGWIDKNKSYEARNNIWGIQRSGDVIWIGSPSFGVLAFDTIKNVWSRYDVEDARKPGAYRPFVFYADSDYVFASGFHIFSVKRQKWIKVDAVPIRNVTRLGTNIGLPVQLEFDLRNFANEKYLPIRYETHVDTPDKVLLSADKSSYVFYFRHSDAHPTEFRIEKWELEWAFSQMRD